VIDSTLKKYKINGFLKQICKKNYYHFLVALALEPWLQVSQKATVVENS
jgi:hypothetical protein